MKTTVTNHTPGPWERNGNAVHKRLSKHYAECVAIVGSDNKTGDANLIAAAPELLESLQAMTELFEMEYEANQPGTSSYLVLFEARKAIAKATGAS